MGQDQGKEGFFSKLKSIITGSPILDKPSVGEPRGPHSPATAEALDLRFVKNFTQSGGHFIYCENIPTLRENINNVCAEQNIKFVYTIEDDIKSILKETNVEISSDYKRSNAICSNCEALVAQMGGIMIDDFQTGGIRLGELPEIHIIIGKTSQIVDGLHAGMARINNRYKQNRPGQLTTLKGPKEESVVQSTNDQNAKRVLYLLLLEDEFK